MVIRIFGSGKSSRMVEDTENATSYGRKRKRIMVLKMSSYNYLLEQCEKMRPESEGTSAQSGSKKCTGSSTN